MGTGSIMVKVLSVDNSDPTNIPFPKYITSVWLSEIGNTGNFTGPIVKFTSGPTDGSVPQVHAEVGWWAYSLIPQTSIWTELGDIVPQVDLSQEYADMRFEPNYSDCNNFGGDEDGDGICANWETGDGFLKINYTGTPPDPNVPDYIFNCGECDDDTKDIFLEIDFMLGQQTLLN